VGDVREMRLIDANALKKKLEEAGLGDHSLIESVLAAGVYAGIENAPTIDAVPVVRCRECKEYIYPAGVCKYWNRPVRCDGYCNCGAKMDAKEVL
jgi:hypothetical protein